MVDKYVAVDRCFDECFKAQVGQYPDNDKNISKDYHLDGPPIHAILLCTKASLPSYGNGFAFTKKIDQKFVVSCSNKSVADVKGLISADTEAKRAGPSPSPTRGMFEKMAIDKIQVCKTCGNIVEPPEAQITNDAARKTPVRVNGDQMKRTKTLPKGKPKSPRRKKK
jgi:hypothetical protein